MTGPIPRELGSLTNLASLYLGENELTGPIPRELGSLANLELLFLGANYLTGSIPRELGNLANLWGLVLGRNELTGAIPRELGNLTNLQELILWRNPLTGSLPQSLIELQLIVLDIRQTGACVPADAEFLAWLETIDSFYGDTCNRPPEPVGTVPPQALVASGPALGVSMESYFRDPNDDPLTYSAASSHGDAVTTLTSGHTVWLVPVAAGPATVMVTARDPDGLSAVQTMSVTTTASAGPQSDRDVLEVFYDSTGGAGWTDSTNWKTSAPLDDWHGVTTDLAGRVTELNLPGNGLTGPIPDALGDLALLQTLNFGWRWDPTSQQPFENALIGPIPPPLGNLTELRWLNLARNDLTGSIPDELGSVVNLQTLDL